MGAVAIPSTTKWQSIWHIILPGFLFLIFSVCYWDISSPLHLYCVVFTWNRSWPHLFSSLASTRNTISPQSLKKIRGGIIKSCTLHLVEHLWPHPCPQIPSDPKSPIRICSATPSQRETHLILLPPGFSLKSSCLPPTLPIELGNSVTKPQLGNSVTKPLAHASMQWTGSPPATRIYPWRAKTVTINNNSVTYESKSFIIWAVLIFHPPNHLCLMNTWKCNIKEFLKKCSHRTTI